MNVRVELFGIARRAAGVAATTAAGGRLDEVLIDLARRFPQLAQSCLGPGRLRPGYLANLNGDRFINDPTTPVAPGDCLLILPADAGG